MIGVMRANGPDDATDCLFCKIVAGDVPSDRVFESERVLAFRDINPGAPIHVLVIPKEHVPSVQELSREHDLLTGEMLEVVRTVAEREGIADGYRLVTNVGARAGQSVFHLHWHVLGGRPLAWPPG